MKYKFDIRKSFKSSAKKYNKPVKYPKNTGGIPFFDSFIFCSHYSFLNPFRPTLGSLPFPRLHICTGNGKRKLFCPVWMSRGCCGGFWPSFGGGDSSKFSGHFVSEIICFLFFFFRWPGQRSRNLFDFPNSEFCNFSVILNHLLFTLRSQEFLILYLLYLFCPAVYGNWINMFESNGLFNQFLFSHHILWEKLSRCICFAPEWKSKASNQNLD